MPISCKFSCWSKIDITRKILSTSRVSQIRRVFVERVTQYGERAREILSRFKFSFCQNVHDLYVFPIFSVRKRCGACVPTSLPAAQPRVFETPLTGELNDRDSTAVSDTAHGDFHLLYELQSSAGQCPSSVWLIVGQMHHVWQMMHEDLIARLKKLFAAVDEDGNGNLEPEVW